MSHSRSADDGLEASTSSALAGVGDGGSCALCASTRVALAIVKSELAAVDSVLVQNRRLRKLVTNLKAELQERQNSVDSLKSRLATTSCDLGTLKAQLQKLLTEKDELQTAAERWKVLYEKEVQNFQLQRADHLALQQKYEAMIEREATTRCRLQLALLDSSDHKEDVRRCQPLQVAVSAPPVYTSSSINNVTSSNLDTVQCSVEAKQPTVAAPVVCNGDAREPPQSALSWSPEEQHPFATFFDDVAMSPNGFGSAEDGEQPYADDGQAPPNQLGSGVQASSLDSRCVNGLGSAAPSTDDHKESAAASPNENSKPAINGLEAVWRDQFKKDSTAAEEQQRPDACRRSIKNASDEAFLPAATKKQRLSPPCQRAAASLNSVQRRIMKTFKEKCKSAIAAAPLQSNGRCVVKPIASLQPPLSPIPPTRCQETRSSNASSSSVEDCLLWFRQRSHLPPLLEPIKDVEEEEEEVTEAPTDVTAVGPSNCNESTYANSEASDGSEKDLLCVVDADVECHNDGPSSAALDDDQSNYANSDSEKDLCVVDVECDQSSTSTRRSVAGEVVNQSVVKLDDLDYVEEFPAVVRPCCESAAPTVDNSQPGVKAIYRALSALFDKCKQADASCVVEELLQKVDHELLSSPDAIPAAVVGVLLDNSVEWVHFLFRMTGVSGRMESVLLKSERAVVRSLKAIAEKCGDRFLESVPPSLRRALRLCLLSRGRLSQAQKETLCRFYVQLASSFAGGDVSVVGELAEDLLHVAAEFPLDLLLSILMTWPLAFKSIFLDDSDRWRFCRLAFGAHVARCRSALAEKVNHLICRFCGPTNAIEARAAEAELFTSSLLLEMQWSAKVEVSKKTGDVRLTDEWTNKVAQASLLLSVVDELAVVVEKNVCDFICSWSTLNSGQAAARGGVRGLICALLFLVHVAHPGGAFVKLNLAALLRAVEKLIDGRGGHSEALRNCCAQLLLRLLPWFPRRCSALLEANMRSATSREYAPQWFADFAVAKLAYGDVLKSPNVAASQSAASTASPSGQCSR